MYKFLKYKIAHSFVQKLNFFAQTAGVGENKQLTTICSQLKIKLNP